MNMKCTKKCTNSKIFYSNQKAPWTSTKWTQLSARICSAFVCSVWNCSAFILHSHFTLYVIELHRATRLLPEAQELDVIRVAIQKKVKRQAIVWYKKRELSILHIQTKKASQHTYPLDKAANIDFLLHPLQEAVRYG